MSSSLRRLASHVRGVVVLVAVGVLGCQACPRNDPAPLHEAAYSAKERYPSVEAPVAEGLAASLALPAEVRSPCSQPLKVLALTGGVAGAPFTAGVLVGWTESGTRPIFDQVTGISSGALIGAYAFLGPEYDDKLRHLILGLRSDDLFRFRALGFMLRCGAFGSANPAERLIQREIDDQFLADLRRAHAEGRRYFVGTMNMETKRLVIWDVGAIASSGRPDACCLVRKVLLAAVSWPGAVPPVEFDVEVNGCHYHELHCDAGSVSMAFVRFGPLPGWPVPGAPVRPGWLAGSDLYVLASRKLYSDPAPVSKCALPRFGLSLAAIFEALTRADIARLYPLCALSGMRFHLLAVPKDYHGRPMSVGNLYPKDAPRLFEIGYHIGAVGPCWRCTPPGAEASEEAVPQDGSEIKPCQ